jgi:hypothetical protein
MDFIGCNYNHWDSKVVAFTNKNVKGTILIEEFYF